MDVFQRILLVFFAALAVSRAIVDEELNRRCQAQGSCAACIQESPDCGWCSDTDLPQNSDDPENQRRCNAIDREVISSPSCAILQDPQGDVETSSDQFGGLTQVIPRRANVRVRPGASETFRVQVQPANNFPIDLYLLMDLSFSMNDDLINLKRLGTQLADRISDISNNFTLGFGSFVDKKVASFINIDPRRLLDPCRAGCAPPYSYRHVISLTEDNQVFSQRINDQVISGNQDFPEGGFDGLLQSIVCTDFIGWRDVSRKILLYISDAGFHFAGDGLLGGVVKPNDGLCHMEGEQATQNDDGTVDYEAYATLDFPSIGQIAEKIDEFDIIPIFAVIRDFQDLYRLLQNELGNRAYLGELDSDSSNVVDLVERLYNEISTSVVFSQVNIPGVSVTVEIVNCPGQRGGVCTGVGSGETVSFDVSVAVTECTPELMAGPKEFELRVVGFGVVAVNLSAACDCDCNAENQQEANSEECNLQGTLVCGTCVCNSGYFGDRCQCDNSGTEDGENVECPAGLDGLECSGRGICTCGICECRTGANGEERFYGIACECDNTVCERGIENEICSGPSRGECTCDGCRCLPEPETGGLLYTRSDCSCTPNTRTCIDPRNATDICNGRGVCECGVCICESPYFGDYCDLCSGDDVCQTGTCDVEGESHLCAECAVDLLEALNNASSTDELQLFTDEGLMIAIYNLSLIPMDSVLTFLEIGEVNVSAIELPKDFVANCSAQVNGLCPGFFIVNEEELMDNMSYTIENFDPQQCSVDRQCQYPYFVTVDEAAGELLPIHVLYPPLCPMVDETGGGTTRRGRGSGDGLPIPPWAIALILVGILLLIGIIALILLKVLLIILDYVEVAKFEKELQKIKYTKNENPLYHSATKDYKNPIYGQ